MISAKTSDVPFQLMFLNIFYIFCNKNHRKLSLKIVKRLLKHQNNYSRTVSLVSLISLGTIFIELSASTKLQYCMYGLYCLNSCLSNIVSLRITIKSHKLYGKRHIKMWRIPAWAIKSADIWSVSQLLYKSVIQKTFLDKDLGDIPH